MDVLASFIADRCVMSPNARTGATPLYQAYQWWCKDNGEDAANQTAFGLSLRERGFEQDRDPKTRRKVWLGIGLFSDDEPPPDGDARNSSKQSKQFETEFRHSGLAKEKNSVYVERGFRTVSEEPNCFANGGEVGDNKRHSQGSTPSATKEAKEEEGGAAAQTPGNPFPSLADSVPGMAKEDMSKSKAADDRLSPEEVLRSKELRRAGLGESIARSSGAHQKL
jgi:hypothetical protein